MGRFLQSLVSILYPPVCPMCGRVVQGTGGRSVACRDCRRSLMYVGPNHCMKCGKPLDEENGELCFDCEKTRHVYDQGDRKSTRLNSSHPPESRMPSSA